MINQVMNLSGLFDGYNHQFSPDNEKKTLIRARQPESGLIHKKNEKTGVDKIGFHANHVKACFSAGQLILYLPRDLVMN